MFELEKNRDSRIDIYSIGCVLYELIIGKPLHSIHQSETKIFVFNKLDKLLEESKFHKYCNLMMSINPD